MNRVPKQLFLSLCGLMLLVVLSLNSHHSAVAQVNSGDANLLQNGDFSSGTENWWVQGSDITSDTSSGALCVVIQADGANPWDIQVGQAGFALEDGVAYEISFDAYASSARTVSFKTGSSSFANYTYQTVDVGTTETAVSVTYTQTPADNNAQFEFHLGRQGTGEVCLDNVVVAPVSAEPSNLILNGDFSDGFNNWFTSFAGSGAATTDTSSGALCINVTDGASFAYELLVGQADVNLNAGNTYEISFNVQADRSRNLSYKTGESSPPFVDYTYQTTGIGTAWQTIVHQYVQPTDDSAAQFQLHLGGEGTGEVCVDDVSLTVVSVAPPDGDNLLVNGRFEEGLTPWQLQLSGTGAATADTSSGALCVDITDPSANQWEIVVNQAGLNLNANKEYLIQFDVMADNNRELFFKTGNTSFENYTYQSAQATTNWSTVAFSYQQPQADENGIFEFQLGARGAGQICLDNVLLQESIPAADRDIAQNGSFENGLANWTFFTQNDALLSPEVANEEMRLSVTQLGQNSFDAMLWQVNLPVVNDYQYILQFDARADVADGETRELFAKVGKQTPNYDTYGGGAVDLTNQMQSFAFDFTMNAPTDGCSRIEFHLAQAVGDIYIDNVKLLTNAPEDFDTGVEDYETASIIGRPLRELAEERDFYIGTANETTTFACNSLHNDVLMTEFNSFTPSNAMKMGPLVPIRGQYQWADADAMVDFAETNGMAFHGHALVWHTQMPSWAENGDFDRAEMLDIMYAHIDTVMGRYAGRIAVWDVVNEAIEDETFGLRVTPWQQNIGDDYISLAFEQARLADSTAQLLYNDYNISQLGHPKADAVFAMIEQMVADGVPIDGVGFQMHWDLTEPPNVQAVIDNMARYEAIDVEVYVTEIDVRIPDERGDDALDEAADVYEAMLLTCLNAPNCNHFTTWGMSDLDSWIPGFFEGFDRAHIFDAEFEARPAYHALVTLLDNDAPVVESVTVPTEAVSALDGDVVVSASFGDVQQDSDAPFSCTVDFGDGSTPAEGVVEGTVCTSHPHQYAEAGLFFVTVMVQDVHGEVGELVSTLPILVYSATNGAVYGWGSVETAEGEASFNVNGRYSLRRDVPYGRFRFTTDSFRFRSTGYELLILADGYSLIEGFGRVTNQRGYAFRLTMVDGATDALRLQIWDGNRTELIYDSHPELPAYALNIGPILRGQIYIYP